MKQFATLKNALYDDEFLQLLDEENFGRCFRALISPNSRGRLYGAIVEEGINPLTNMKSIPARCFAHYGGLEELIIPAYTEIIYDEAFCECCALSSVKFAKNSPQLRIIRSKAFTKCYNLEEIEFPKSLMQIHDKAFYGCTNLRKVKFIGDDLEVLAPDAFQNCHKDLAFEVPKDHTDLIEFLESSNYKVETY